MNTTRRAFGFGLIGLGVAGALAASLWLAVSLGSGVFDVSAAFTNALLVFVPLALIMLAGGYIVSRTATVHETDSPVHRQRQLIDALAHDGRVYIAAFAHQNAMEAEDVVALVDALAVDGLFVGVVDLRGGVVFRLTSAEAALLRQCRVCSAALPQAFGGRVVCHTCASITFGVSP